MAEEAVAYVSIVPVSRGAGKTIADQIDGSGVGQSVGRQLGSGITTAIGKTMQGAATATVAAAAATFGTALVKGFSRLTAIDQATAKLRGLGNSASDIAEIMNNATASVKGTAFGLDAAATVAAAAVASGIKPGQQLQSVLKTIADTATIAGASMEDTGAIFNSVAARGKLQGDDLMQLQSRGVPVLAFLAKHYGITAQAASDMVSKGEVDFQNFAAAMQENLGGAALSSGDTFTGALANVFASLGRIGANIEKGVFPKIAPLFQTLTAAMSPLEDRATAIGEAIGNRVNPVLDKLSALLKGGIGDVKGISSLLGPLAAAFAALGASGFAPLIAGVPFLKEIAPALKLLGGPVGILTAAFAGLVATSPALQSAFGNLIGQFNSLFSVMGPIVGQLTSGILPAFTLFAQQIAVVLANAIISLTPALVSLVAILATFAGSLLPQISPIVTAVGAALELLIPTIAALGASFASILADVGPVVVAIGMGLAGAIQAVLPVLLNVVDFLAGLATGLAGNKNVIIGLVGAYALWKTTVGAISFAKLIAGLAVSSAAWVRNAAAQAVSKAQTVAIAAMYTGSFIANLARSAAGIAVQTAAWVANTAALVVSRGVMLAGAAATGIATAAQWAWNAALTANPIGVIIVAIAALVAGLIWFFTQTKIGQQIWSGFVSFLTAAWSSIVQVATTVFTALGTFFSAVWQGIVLTAQPFVDFFAAYVVPLIQAAIGLIVAILRFFWNTTVMIFTGIWNEITIAVNAIVLAVTTGFQAVSNFVQTVFNAVASFVNTVWTAIYNFIAPIVNRVVITISTVWGALVATVSGIWNGLVNGIRVAFNAVTGFVSGIVNGVVNTIRVNWSALVSIVTTIFNSVSNAVRAPINNMVSFISGIKDRIVGALSGAGTWLLDIGKKIIGGLIQGIKNALGGLTDLLHSVTNLIPANKGPIELDRVLLTPNGEAIMQSLINGISGKTGALQKTLQGITAEIPLSVGASAEYATTSVPTSRGVLDSIATPTTAGRVTNNTWNVQTPDPEGIMREYDRRQELLGA